MARRVVNAHQPVADFGRLGLALRETFTNKYNVYSDDPNTAQIEKSKIEGGLESVTELVLQLEDNILYKSQNSRTAALLRFS